MAKKKAQKQRHRQKRRQKRAAKAKRRAPIRGSTPPRDLDFAFEDDDAFDDMPPLPDRRAMESQMAGITGMYRGEEDDDPLAEAQRLMWDAFGERDPRKKVSLARQALKLSPDCADAYVLLAELAARTPEEAAELYRKGVEAGERALGPEFFEEGVGHFWGVLESRPYMRARAGLAGSLLGEGKVEKAAEHFADMLRLNPGDNQGLRYQLVPLLFVLERFDELAELLDEYEGDGTAGWTYSRALLAFHDEGDSENARELLSEAFASNSHVPAYLLGVKQLPRSRPPTTILGHPSEAYWYVVETGPCWKLVPGALDWMAKLAPEE